MTGVLSTAGANGIGFVTAQCFAATGAMGCLVAAKDVADRAMFLSQAPRNSGQAIAVKSFTINPDPKV